MKTFALACQTLDSTIGNHTNFLALQSSFVRKINPETIFALSNQL